MRKGRGIDGRAAVMKTTGSAFENFVRDEFTTLVEVNDRIFSTSVELEYTFAGPISLETADGKVKEASLDAANKALSFSAVAKRAREITLKTFAVDESASVQATLYKMGVQIAILISISFQLRRRAIARSFAESNRVESDPLRSARLSDDSFRALQRPYRDPVLSIAPIYRLNLSSAICVSAYLRRIC